VIEALDGLPALKEHCSVLAEQTIHNAINNYRESQGLELWEDDFKIELDKTTLLINQL